MHTVVDNSTVNNTTIKRTDIVADDKMEAEGAAEEEKICFGWLLNTRKLLVKLPAHKAIAWTSQINNILGNRSMPNKELQSILGRLENIAQIMISLGHFLGNIRYMQILAENKGHSIRLNTQTKEDLKLVKQFIQRAEEGISMNLLTFRAPSIIYICDALEYALGGFASHERTWSFRIPKNLRNRAHINILEYLAQIISIWTDAIEGKTQQDDCLLSIGDNTSALGWMRRSNNNSEES